MKRIKIHLFFTILLILTIISVACNKVEGSTVIDGKEVIISKEDNTITIGTDVYYYSTNYGMTEITITYPNGAKYTRTYIDKYSSSGGWNIMDGPSVKELGYIDEGWLVDIVEQNTSNRSIISTNLLYSVIILLIGLFLVTFPDMTWYLSYGWRYKDAEPSDMALIFERIGGIGLIIFAIVVLFQ